MSENNGRYAIAAWPETKPEIEKLRKLLQAERNSPREPSIREAVHTAIKEAIISREGKADEQNT